MAAVNLVKETISVISQGNLCEIAKVSEDSTLFEVMQAIFKKQPWKQIALFARERDEMRDAVCWSYLSTGEVRVISDVVKTIGGKTFSSNAHVLTTEDLKQFSLSDFGDVGKIIAYFKKPDVKADEKGSKH